MFDSQCDLAARVYEPGQHPDGILREFAAGLNARGHRAVELVQLGRHCTDVPNMSAMLIHSGEELPLLQNLGSCTTGCRLDVGRLLDADSRGARSKTARTSSSSTGSGGKSARAKASLT
jgi:hypothetical protein